MSKEFIKRMANGDTVIYENEEARWVFSKGRPPHIDDYQVAITAVDRKVRVPIMMIMSGREFRSLLRDMGIKTLTDPRDRERVTYKGIPIEFDNLTGLNSHNSQIVVDLLAVVETVKEYWQDNFQGCFFCGFKEHKATCSLNNAVVNARQEIEKQQEAKLTTSENCETI